MSKRRQKSVSFQLSLETLKEESPTDEFEFLIPDIPPPLKNRRNIIPTGKQIPRTPRKTEITVTKPSLEPSIDSESCRTKTDESLLKNMIPKGREIPRTPPNFSNLPFLLNESQPRTSSYLKPIDLGVKPLEDMDDIAIKLDYITIRKRPKPKSYNLDLVKSETKEVVNLGDDSKDLHADDSQKKSTRKYVHSKIVNKPQDCKILEQKKPQRAGKRQKISTKLHVPTNINNASHESEMLEQRNLQLVDERQKKPTKIDNTPQNPEISEQKKPQHGDVRQKKSTKLHVLTEIGNKPQEYEILEKEKLNLRGEKQKKSTRLRNTTKWHNTTQDTEISQQKKPQLEYDRQKKSTRLHNPTEGNIKLQDSEILEQKKPQLADEKQKKCAKLKIPIESDNTSQDSDIMQQKKPQLEDKKQEISTRLHNPTEGNIKLQDSEILEQKKPQLADEKQKKCAKLPIPTKIDNKPQDSEILEQFKSDNTPQNPDILGHKMEQHVKKVEIAKNTVQVNINHQHKLTSEAKPLAGAFVLAADHSIENVLKDNLKCQGLRIGESTMKNDTKSNDEMAEQKKRRTSRIPRRSSMISNQEGECSNTVKMQKQQGCINKQNVEVGKNNAKDNVKKQGVGDALLRNETKQYKDEAVEKKNGRARRIPKVSSLASKEDEKRCDVELEGDENKENICVTKRECGNSALSSVKGGSKCSAREKCSLPSALQTRRNPSRQAKLSVNYCQ